MPDRSASVRHVLWACWTSYVVHLYHYDNASARWFADPSQPRPDNAREIAVTIQALRDPLEGESMELRDGDWYPRR